MNTMQLSPQTLSIARQWRKWKAGPILFFISALFLAANLLYLVALSYPQPFNEIAVYRIIFGMVLTGFSGAALWYGWRFFSRFFDGDSQSKRGVFGGLFRFLALGVLLSIVCFGIQALLVSQMTRSMATKAVGNPSMRGTVSAYITPGLEDPQNPHVSPPSDIAVRSLANLLSVTNFPLPFNASPDEPWTALLSGPRSDINIGPFIAFCTAQAAQRHDRHGLCLTNGYNNVLGGMIVSFFFIQVAWVCALACLFSLVRACFLWFRPVTRLPGITSALIVFAIGLAFYEIPAHSNSGSTIDGILASSVSGGHAPFVSLFVTTIGRAEIHVISWLAPLASLLPGLT